jgi:hypothetical protein
VVTTNLRLHLAVTNALTALKTRLQTLLIDPTDLRKYVIDHYLVLYAKIEGAVYLLSINHHRQVSFDYESYWG